MSVVIVHLVFVSLLVCTLYLVSSLGVRYRFNWGVVFDSPQSPLLAFPGDKVSV